jgi:diacylglycerol kinase (ATP)
VTRTLLIENAGSGAADAGALERVEMLLGDLGPVRRISPSSPETFDAEVFQGAADCGLVVVAGGDGTANCALNALSARLHEIVFGLIPMGTGNDLARTLGLPRGDPAGAARVVVEGRERDIDLGRATGPERERLFANACMGGFPVEVNQAIGGELKKRLGPAAFWVGGAKAAARLDRTMVTMNGVALDDCVAVGVGNGRTCGGGIEMWPTAIPDDGILNGCALAAANRSAGLMLAARLRAGAHEALESVETVTGPRIEITSDPDVELNVDGELVGLTTPAVFELIGTLRIRC